jgi:hypothetical protein
MRYAFLVETYATERIKVVSVWSEFRDEDLRVRPRSDDARGAWKSCWQADRKRSCLEKVERR